MKFSVEIDFSVFVVRIETLTKLFTDWILGGKINDTVHKFSKTNHAANWIPLTQAKKNLMNTETPTPETDRSFDDNGVCGRCADSRGSIGRSNRVGHDVLLSNQFNTTTNLALSEITPTLGGRLVLVINLFSYLNKWRKLKRYWIDEKRRNIANCEKASQKSGLLRSIYLIDDAGSQESWTSICKRFHFLLFLNYIFLLHEQHRLVQNSIDSTTKSTEGRVDGYNKHITQLIFYKFQQSTS